MRLPETISARWNARLDKYDRRLCQSGWLQPAHWDAVRAQKVTRLYAGELFRGLPQFLTHYGLSIGEGSLRNISHDVRHPLPIPDSCVDVYQSEDVFEHVPYDELAPVFDEIFRVLRPGGLFRLSVPDYRCALLASRSLRKADGELLFDPGGGGELVNRKVVNGGHVWFPQYETVKALFDASRFSSQGSIDFLHYTAADGEYVVRPIAYSLGYISRTPDHDHRVGRGEPMSIVVDARRLS